MKWLTLALGPWPSLRRAPGVTGFTAAVVRFLCTIFHCAFHFLSRSLARRVSEERCSIARGLMKHEQYKGRYIQSETERVRGVAVRLYGEAVCCTSLPADFVLLIPSFFPSLFLSPVYSLSPILFLFQCLKSRKSISWGEQKHQMLIFWLQSYVQTMKLLYLLLVIVTEGKLLYFTCLRGRQFILLSWFFIKTVLYVKSYKLITTVLISQPIR